MSATNYIPTVLEAPDGYVVDFDNPQRIAVPEAYYVTAVTTFLGVLMIAQRLYTKIFIVRKVQLDDVFLVLSWLISISVVGLYMFAVKAGGVHGWEIDIPTYNIFMKGVYVASAIYIVGGSFAKISLLIFYFRLSPQRWFRIANWTTLATISAYTIGIFFSLIFACDPIEKGYDITKQHGTCINRPYLYIATAVTNIASDIVLFCLPLPIVIKLQVPRKQKVGLVLIFFLGSLTLVTSIIRVTMLPEMLYEVDQTWIIAPTAIWIIVEANLFIMCAALPTLRKFLKHFAPKLIGESYGGSSKATGPANGTGGINSGLRTIGGTGGNATRTKRSQYSQFDDGGSDTAGGFILQPYPEGSSTSAAVASEPTSRWQDSDDGVWPDNDSEKAIVKNESGIIVQTKSVTVEYTTQNK